MNIQEKVELNYMFEGVDIYDLQDDERIKEVRFKGSNKNNVVVIYQLEGGEELSGEELLFLEKILGAVKLKLDEAALVNMDMDKVSFTALKNRVVFTRMIAFGLLPGDLSLNINYKKYFKFGLLNTEVLFADSIKDLIHDPPKKSWLWKGLKTLFEIEQNV